MAQSPPFPDVAGYAQQRSLIKDPCSLAAKEAITDKTGELCGGMDSLSVALQLHQKHLLSDNDLEAVRDFQEVRVAKNSRLLQSVKNAITVTGVQGFQDFLSILGEFHLLDSVVTDLQRLYEEHLRRILKWNEQNREFWERQNALHGTPPMQSILPPSSTWQQSSSLHHSHMMPVTWEGDRGYCARPPCAGSSLSSGPLTPFSPLQPMPTNHLCEHMANGMLPHNQSKLLSLMPSHPSHDTHPLYTHTPSPSHSKPVPLHANPPQPCHSNSAPSPSCSVLPHLIPGWSPLGADGASSSCCPMDHSNFSLHNTEPIPSQSSPTLVQSDDGGVSALAGLSLEQPTPSPSLSAASNQLQPALEHIAWQQEVWLQSGCGRHSSFDSGLSSLHSNSLTAQHSITTRVGRFAEGLPHPSQQPTTPAPEIHSNSSSSDTRDNGLEEHGGSMKLHRQGGFDEGSVSKQRNHTDSMDSGITGSQASLGNEDETH